MIDSDKLLLEIYRLQEESKNKINETKSTYTKGQLRAEIRAFQKVIDILKDY